MPYPRLLHPVPIVIEQIDSASTPMDNDYREPVQKSNRKIQKTVPGQMNWGRDQSLEVSIGGRMEHANGYVLFRYIDLEMAGIELRTDDRIIQMGAIKSDVYIVGLVPQGHYAWSGSAIFTRAYFKDRQPAKQGLGIQR